jgi:hypothetical protein
MCISADSQAVYNFVTHAASQELNRKSRLAKLNKPIVKFPSAALKILSTRGIFGAASERKHSWVAGRFPGASANMRGVCVYVLRA